MGSALRLNLEAFAPLSQEDRGLIEAAASKSIKTVSARRDLISEGEKPTAVHLVLEGWACRYKQLPDGRRQIVSFMIPGDFCDSNAFVLREMDHSIGAITRVRYAEIAAADFEALMADSPKLTAAMWWQELANCSIQREWTTNVGQRMASERLGHLFCEMFLRLSLVGRTKGTGCEWPLTQYDLADATGLTAIHVNRTLQELRRQGLIELKDKWLNIPDFEELKRVSLFNPNYLHVQRRDWHHGGTN